MSEKICENCGFEEFNHPVENVFLHDDVPRVSCEEFKPPKNK